MFYTTLTVNLWKMVGFDASYKLVLSTFRNFLQEAAKEFETNGGLKLVKHL